MTVELNGKNASHPASGGGSSPVTAANQPGFSFVAAGMDFDVVEFTASEKISSPFEVDLALVSEDEIAFDEVISQSGLLIVEGSDSDRYFHGIINRFIQTGTTGRFFTYQACLVPQIWLLTLERDCRIFQQKSVPQIVQTILEDSGITSDIFQFRLQGNYASRDYCVQYRESDLDFMSRLLEEEGIFYFFEHQQDKHMLVFGDSTVNYQPIAGEPEVIFNAGGAMVSEQEAVFRFLRLRSVCTGKYTLRDFDFSKPGLNLTVQKDDDENISYERYDCPGDYLTENDGKRLAQVRLEEAIMFKEKVEGDSVCPRFLPGFTFKLSGHDLATFNQSYLLYHVQHTGSQPQVLQERSAESAGTSYTNLFHAIPSDITLRPERKTPKPVVEGVQTAIVTGPANEEIHTDKHGRVKVQFHWDRLGKKDDKSSCWIRVSQVSAGAGWGAMDVPRVGHEVIVDFIEGDPDHPIIIGRVYNGENHPPFDLPQSGMVSGMKSNTTPNGGGYNQISMDDTKGKEVLTIHAQKDMSSRIENNQSASIGADQTISVGGDQSISISGAHSQTITKDAKITIGDGNYTRNVKTGTATLHVKGAVKQDYDATLKTTVGENIEVTSKGGHVHITGSSDIHLKTGASEFQMKSDGSIKLKGVDIAIEGVTVTIHGVTITSKADTVNATEGATIMVDGKATTTIKGGMLMLNP